ncbi:MAG: transcription termination factor Rho [Phycisphaerales bacterium]|nr:MAG: transcription termination factor Rho [Phycisphaerales bacterium]
MSEQVSGVYEPNGRSGGFLRDPGSGYRVRPNDAIVPPKLCQGLNLRGGETLVGTVVDKASQGRRPKLELAEVESIDGLSTDDRIEAKPFEDLVPIDPNRQLRFEIPDGSPSMRVIDLMTPIGFGQRGLICAPPRTGKTILLQQMADGIATNYPKAHLIVLLVDERPEEVTDMRRKVRGEVAASSNDKDAASHIRLVRLVIEKAKRLVEAGRDVVILLDSLTRLGRAFNTFIRGSGRIMSGGLDSSALNEPKAVFGAARNIEHGGSLTIVASALIDTGSRMDEVIFNEFKGTGNMEIMLSREMANKRLWPAIDLNLSGTRKEELLLTPQALEVSCRIRRSLGNAEPVRAMQVLLDQMGKHDSNSAFVEQHAEQTLR